MANTFHYGSDQLTVQTVLGIASGKIKAVLNEQTGESFYTVQVRTASNALKDRDGRPLPIGTGMVADVSLLGDKRSVLSYLLSPITRLGERAFRE